MCVDTSGPDGSSLGPLSINPPYPFNFSCLKEPIPKEGGRKRKMKIFEVVVLEQNSQWEEAILTRDLLPYVCIKSNGSENKW